MIERVGEETGAEFVLIPQLPDVRMVAEATDLPVVAPYADALEPGRGVGRVLPEAVAAAGAEGVVINHAENRDTLSAVSLAEDPGSLLRAIGGEVAAVSEG